MYIATTLSSILYYLCSFLFLFLFARSHRSNNITGVGRQRLRMLGNLVNYLFGGNFSGTQDSLESDPLTTRSIMRRFKQVEVEGDDWILINRAGTQRDVYLSLIYLSNKTTYHTQRQRGNVSSMHTIYFRLSKVIFVACNFAIYSKH